MKTLLKSNLLVKLTFCYFIFGMLNSSTTFCQTYISGIIGSNTTWTKSNSPYIVTGNTVVMSNVVLNIEHGVIVKFRHNVQLSLRGKIIGIGTLSDSIIFTADTIPTRWSGVLVDNSSYNPKVNLRFFRGNYASILFGVSSTTSSSDTLLNFSRCIFKNINEHIVDEYDAVKTHIIYFDSCVFHNPINGYCSEGASNFIIKNSRFFGENSNVGRALYNGSPQNTIIDNCEFSGYSDIAIIVNGIITNSSFHNNNTAIATNSGSSPVLHYNDIHDNITGIEAWNYGTSNSPTQITHNRICNNTTSIRKIYNSDTYAFYNCWCSSDSSQIETTIHDFFDAANLGIVFFIPFDITCENDTIQTNLNHEAPILNSSFNLFPNPINNSFTINVNLVSTSNLKIEIIDLMGNVVSDLYNGIIESGNHQLNFSTANLSSGIYFLTISSIKEKITKKIVKL